MIRFEDVNLDDLNIEDIKIDPVIEWLQAWLKTAVDGGILLVLKVIIGIIIFFIGKKVLNMLLKLADRSMERIGTEISVKKFLTYLLRAIGYVTIGLIILQAIGYEATSLVAVVGSAGIALGLALQGSLANFAGGVLILLMRPFKVGDYILDDKGNEGTVKSIGLVYTELATTDNRIVVIPNGTLANSSMTNTTAQDKRRLDLTVGISYQADLTKAKALVSEILYQNPHILKEEEILTFVSGLAASEVTIGCRAWVPTEQYWTVRWDVLERIKLEFDREGVEIPYNQLDVHVK